MVIAVATVAVKPAGVGASLRVSGTLALLGLAG